VNHLRAVVFTSLLLLASSVGANERPLLLSPTYTTAPPANYEFVNTAFEGNWMIAAGGVINTDPFVGSPYSTAAVFLYRRGGLGAWVLQSKLAEVPYFWEWNSTGVSLAMENGLLAFELNKKLYIYERTPTGFTQTAVLDDGYDSAAIRIDGQRILAGLGNCNGAAVVEKNAAGVWAISGRLQTTGADCYNDFSYTDFVDFSGDSALVGVRGGPRTAQAFRRVAGQLQWLRTVTLPASQYNVPVALRGSLALVSGDVETRTIATVYRRTGNNWDQIDSLRYVDRPGGASPIRQRADLWMLNNDLWRQNADDTFSHLARLSVGADDVGGRTAVGTTLAGEIATYILPTAFPKPPAALRDDFEGGGNITWDFQGGFVTAQSGFTHVLRNPSLTTSSEAIVSQDWTDQSIQVDVRPTLLGYGWIGLTARRTDVSNFYQVRISTNQVSLLRRVLGQGDVEIASAGVPFKANYNYRLRFELRGSLLQVYVNDAKVIEVTDRVLTHGAAGLYAYGVTADFDNFIVSPIRLPLFSAYGTQLPELWTNYGGTWSTEPQSVPRARQQTDRTVAARSITGAPDTDDQIIESTVRINSLPPSGDRWVGIMARFHDKSNLYYASLRVNAGVQIRRVQNGIATVLASVPYTVTGSTNYLLRFEAVGDELRVYVNDVFVAEAHDSVFPTGRYGIATNLAAASFAEFNVVQP
jgi:hypothetical protein